ncbi:MAG TPA: hypothetical protein VGX25_25670 [Actinophytocola sp.]|uniref:hypothetical protein n=1 Tax=Actinophytocola sp. TaxID=1872138 RepID=UPI002DDD4EFC|nr:hypothetical protein [Actinophytocola sp.]HEV2782794.1 hypothetical protein [Actinophytocola sp.]
MRESSANYGIQQSGGTSNVGNQAVGPHARAISHGQRFTAPAGAGELLTELMTLLDRHRAELPATAVATAERLREELAKPEPDRGTLSRILDKLNTVVKPVTPLVNTVAELTKAIGSALSG